MASPTNASEPESSDEEEIIDTGFDALLFWDRYRQIILVVGGVVLLGLAAFGIYEYNQSQLIAGAGAALAQAASEDDLRQVTDKYPGTAAAGDAMLLLAGQLRTEQKYDDAAQVLQTFLDKYPTHPLAHAGDLSLAETLEAQGKDDEAMSRYEEVAAKYPDSYSAPLALLAQANLLKSQGKIDDARRVYENFVAQFPDSVFAQQAMAEMHMLRPAAGASSAAASAAPTPESNTGGLSLPGLMNPPPASSPAPAPGATPP
jgi:outer membrane protein assembly factor BamD (BamD/ComL family)